MKKVLLLLSCILLNISLVSAQWQVPSPPDLTNTPLKVGDYITYKARLGFQGATLSQIVQYITNNSIPVENVTELESMVNTTAEILEKVELKVSVAERTNDSITLNAYLYYNASINFNENITKSLSTTEWEETIYPFIRPPNDSADSIMTYINPLLSYFINLTSQMFGIDTSSWIQVKAFRTSAFYAGRYRDVNRLSITIPHIKSDIDTVITKMNISMPTDIRDLYSRIPEMDIDYYIDWDDQYGVLVGSKLSVRFSTMSWIAYRTVETYASATNLWNTSMTDVTMNTLNSLVFGYSENLVTYMVKGFVFGDTSSIVMAVVYVLVPLIVLGGIVGLLKRKKK
jgi:hypothetical protein